MAAEAYTTPCDVSVQDSGAKCILSVQRANLVRKANVLSTMYITNLKLRDPFSSSSMVKCSSFTRLFPLMAQNAPHSRSSHMTAILASLPRQLKAQVGPGAWKCSGTILVQHTFAVAV